MIFGSNSWLGRLKRSFAGVIFGFLMIAAALVGLFRNEGRAVQTARMLEEGAAITQHVDVDEINPEFDGRLVHITGLLEVPGILTDPDFGVSTQGVQLRRKVEMFQWVERRDNRKQTRSGGDDETITVYEYLQEWRAKAVDSDAFKQSAGHANPPFAFAERTVTAQSGSIGAFNADAILGRIPGGAPLVVTEGMVADARRQIGTSRSVGLANGKLYLGQDPSQPAIGDLRVSYEVVSDGQISVIAQQAGNGFSPYQTNAGGSLLMVSRGSVPADAMFDRAMTNNTVITWFIRIAGLLALTVGFGFVLGPVAAAADIVPFAGSLVRLGTRVLSFALASVLGTFTIAIAWFAYRPLVALTVIGIGVAAALAFGYLRRDRGNEQAVPGT